MELISVIVPVYNSEKYLNTCVDSILNQTYRYLEVILVDDGSVDDSGTICDQYAKADNRVNVIHKCNGGLSEARNVGIRKANGSFITFVDSDDKILPDMIEYLYNLIMKFNCSMSLCTHTIVWENGKKRKNLGEGKEEKLSSEECLKRMLYHDVIDTSAWAKLYSAKLFDNVQFPVGKNFEDIGTVYKLFINAKTIACGYKNKYEYWIRVNSITTNGFSDKKLELMEMTDFMAKDVVQVFPDLKNALLCRRIYARFSTLNQMLDISGYEKEKKDIVQFIKANGNYVLEDSLTSIRDKTAVMLLVYGGYNMYRFVWKAVRNQKFIKK